LGTLQIARYVSKVTPGKMDAVLGYNTYEGITKDLIQPFIAGTFYMFQNPFGNK